MSRGIVIGKFYPPHLGHHYLIEAALKASDEVDVLIVDNPTYLIPIQKRAAWISQHHPTANIHIIPDLNDDDNSEAWASHTVNFLGYTPDIVFSSETYGRTWAQAMGCRHVDVDIQRTTFPISGTRVRQDFLKSWDFLSDSVKAGLALRIVIIGAESTGTTTLAKDLAAELNVPWVPEVGRYYAESLQTASIQWTNEDFYNIGRLQQAYEQAVATRSRGIIVCDTNATATEVWQRRYLDQSTDAMKDIAAKDKADLYIVTGDEIPFVQDGTRDGEHIRHEMHEWILQRVAETNVPYLVITGNKQTRLKKAKNAVQKMIKNKHNIG